MTTIAYKDGIMACDSCWTLSDTQVTSLSKIVRLANGALLGQCGDNDAREVIAFLGKIKNWKLMPFRSELLALKQDFGGILVFPKGHIYKVTTREDPLDYKDEVGFTPITMKFASCGSGGDLALGAMAAGKSAVEAVRIACEFDINSRLPTHRMPLHLGEFVK